MVGSGSANRPLLSQYGYSWDYLKKRWRKYENLEYLRGYFPIVPARKLLREVEERNISTDVDFRWVQRKGRKQA